jgi:hypothetical protein
MLALLQHRISNYITEPQQKKKKKQHGTSTKSDTETNGIE